MPTTHTHYKFGQEVLSTLPRPLKKSIEENQTLYNIGLHGPDILFYYFPLFKNPVNSQGYAMHDKSAADFFNHAKMIIERSSDKDAALAYIYGFICHFALDSECHKYIEKMIHVSGISHSEIEMELDRLLLVEENIDPVNYLSTYHVKPTKENAEVIAPFFEDLPPEKIKKTLRSMIFYHKLLLAPGSFKRKVLYAGLKITRTYDSMHGMIMSETPNPDCKDYLILLKKLYTGAVPLAAGLIMNYQRAVTQDIPLPSRFDQTFGAGDNWKNLPL